MRYGSLLHKIWWHYSDGWPYELPENRKRWVPRWLNEWLGRHDYPMWVWRPYCWIRREHYDDSYGVCVYCRKWM